MPVAVSPNAQHDVPITKFGRNSLHYEMIFGNENKDNPTCCGLLTIRNAPEANTFTYAFTAYVIVLEGELDLEDQAKPGEQIVLKAGDVLRIDPGTDIKWSSPSYGKAFFAAEIGHDLNPQDHLIG